VYHTNGRDWAASALFDRSGARAAAADWLGVTASAAAPAAGDTTLTGEITTAGGGLARKQATYAHTTGAATSTLTATFTANANDTLPVVLAKAAVFNAASGGAMPFSSLLSPTATVSAVGDSVTLTTTVTKS
jgi:hypothetical protein